MKAYSVKLAGFLLLLSFCCLLLFSPDSIIYDPLFHHWDVSWFYTCRKTLPSTRYWAYQSGTTEAMTKEQNSTINNNIANFYTDANDGLLEIKDCFSHAAGHKEIYHGKYGKYKFYTKHFLKPPPSYFYVSNIDILLRRNVFVN